jgi:DNA-binding NtrC family response regulator
MAILPTVLIVERDRETRNLLNDLFARAGYRVLTAATTDAAHDILRAHPEIRLMLMDIGPKAKPAGIRLAVQAKKLRPTLELLYTANLTEALSDASGGRPLAELAAMPESLALLIRIVDQLLKA